MNLRIIKDAWIGEQGVKIAESYIGKDDFVKIIPKYDTYYTQIMFDDSWYEGDFSTVIYNDSEGFGHYDYCFHPLYETRYIFNNLNPEGKRIILFCESLSQSVVAFLAAGFSEIAIVQPRYINGNLYEYIREQQFDGVVFLYGQSIIGAHDDETNANYGMYTFE